MADRTGFASAPRPTKVPANTEFTGIAGLMILNKDRQPIFQTPDTPAANDMLQAFLKQAEAQAFAMSELYLGSDNRPSIAFAVPIYAVQGEETPDARRTARRVNTGRARRDREDLQAESR